MDSTGYLHQYSDLVGQQQNLFNSYKGQQDAQNNQIDNTINSYTGQRNQQLGDLQNQYGYNDKLKQLDQSYQALGNTQNILQSLPTDVNNRLMNSGGLVTQGQRNRILGAEQTPITNQVGQLGNTINAENQGFSNARGAINDALGFSDSQHQDLLNSLQSVRDLGYKNYMNQFSGLQNQESAAFQGEQSAAQRELQASEGALNRSSQYALARLPYDMQASYAKALADRGLRPDGSSIPTAILGARGAANNALSGIDTSPDNSFGAQLNRLGSNFSSIPQGAANIIQNDVNMPNKFRASSNLLGSNPLTNAFDSLGYTGLNLLGGLGFSPARQILGTN